jgi:hypothetical protein
MKNKRLILIIWLGLLSQLAFAQLYEVPLNQRIDQSRYIFEGKVLESESFFGPGQKMIYTSHLVQVHSVFKGQFPGDKVEIVTAGGQVGNAAVEITHNIELRPRQHGIFFANPTSRPSYRQPNSGLSLRVYAGLQGFIEFHFDGINPKATEPFRAYQQPETELFPLIEARTGQARYNWTSALREINDFYVKYYFSYPQLSSSGGNVYLDFEIQAEVSGGSYEYGDAGIYIEYDTALLGSSLAGLGLVSITAGDVTSSTDYSFALTDYGTNVLEIDIDAADPPINLGEVDAWAEDVVKVRVDVTNLNPAIEGLFEQSLMDGESYYFDAGSGTYVQFPFVWAVDTVAYAASGAVRIDSVYPTILTAGTFDTLYMEGEGFGNTTGDFFFTDANEGLLTYTEAALADMIWTDTLIKVHVFSRSALDNGVAGSGNVRIITFAGDTISSPPIVLVRYAINNSRDAFNESYLYTLSDIDGDNRFTFYLNDQIGLNSDTADIVRETLLRWQCATGIDWDLSDELRPEDSVDDDSYNLIFFSDSNANNLDAGTLMLTRVFSNDCFENGRAYRHVFETDIAVNKQIPWTFLAGTALPGSGQFDFYSTILHELGHAHLLRHALLDDKVMYAFLDSGEYLRALHPDDIAGGLWIMDSIATPKSGCPPVINQDFTVDCSGITSLERAIEAPFRLAVFPNPISEQTQVVIYPSHPGEYQVSLFSQMGQVIWRTEGIATSEEHHTQLPDLGLPSGMYMLRLSMHGFSTTKTLIK